MTAWQDDEIATGEDLCAVAGRIIDWRAGATLDSPKGTPAHSPNTSDVALVSALEALIAGDESAALTRARRWLASQQGDGEAQASLRGAGWPGGEEEPRCGDLELAAAWMVELLTLPDEAEGCHSHWWSVLNPMPGDAVATTVLTLGARDPKLWPVAVRALARVGLTWCDVAVTAPGHLIDGLSYGLAVAWVTDERPWPFATNWHAALGAPWAERSPVWQLAAGEVLDKLGGRVNQLRPGEGRYGAALAEPVVNWCVAQHQIPDTEAARTLLRLEIEQDASNRTVADLCQVTAAGLLTKTFSD